MRHIAPNSFWYTMDFTERVMVVAIEKNSITFRSDDSNSDLVEILPDTLFVKTYRQVGMDVSVYNGVPLPYIRRHGVK